MQENCFACYRSGLHQIGWEDSIFAVVGWTTMNCRQLHLVPGSISVGTIKKAGRCKRGLEKKRRGFSLPDPARPQPTFSVIPIDQEPETGYTQLLPNETNAEEPLFVGVVFQVSLVLVFMVGVIVYKLLVYRPLASNASTRARAQQIANVTGAFVNLTIIMILSRVGTSCSLLFTSSWRIFLAVDIKNSALI